MADSTVTYRELRVVIEDELTHVYVFCDAGGDSPIGVQGWHYKVFPASRSIHDIVGTLDEDHPFMWPQSAPKN